jgi:hypothetical protein
MKPKILKVVAGCFLILIAGSALIGSGVAPAAYNLIENSGTPLTRRSTLNFVNGGCADNSGASRTDCTVLTSVPSNATCTFTAQTSVTCTHGLGTTAVTVAVYDTSSPPLLILPQSVALTGTNAITVTFSSSQSGTIVVSGSSGSGSGQFYQTVQQAGASLAQEPRLNFPSNMTCVDDPGNTSTDCTPSGGGSSVPTTGWTLTQPSGALATLSDFGPGVALNQESQPIGGGVHFAVATRSLPGSTYTITTTIQCLEANGSSGAVIVCGLALFDGTKSEDIEFLNEYTVDNAQATVRQLTSLTESSGGSLVAGPTNTLIGQYPTFRIVEDGTHRTWYYWSSGAFVMFFQEASGTFLTPTSVGVITLNDSGDTPIFNSTLIVGWSATSP